MKNSFIFFTFTFVLLFCGKSYSQSSLPPSERLLQKNHIKYNYISLLAHTLSLSYEREIPYNISIETEVGYIFPINKYEYAWYNEIPGPYWASQGYLCRESLRYLFKLEQKESVFFLGVSFLYKNRHYQNKSFYEWGKRGMSSDNHILQSEKNQDFAGEFQIGFRTYPEESKHFLMEISLGIGAGKEYRITDVSKFYMGRDDIPINEWPTNIQPHSKGTRTFVSFNPCFKMGFAF